MNPYLSRSPTPPLYACLNTVCLNESCLGGIPDLREQYHPGDELTCVVKQFDRKAGTLEISVKETVPNPFDEASLRHPVGCRRRATIAGKYAGGVFCNLSDGAVVMCRYSFHYEDSDFKTGDTVMVVIQRYDEGKKQIFGKIVGK